MSVFTKKKASVPDSPPSRMPTAAGRSEGSSVVEHPAAPSQSHRNNAPSIISAGLKVIGNLEADSSLQIDGKVEGDVRGRDVKIGENAVVKGSIFGEAVEAAGTIEGKIESRTVIVRKSAHVTGDIYHERLEIEAGAYVDGQCKPKSGKAVTDTASPKPTERSSESHDDADKGLRSIGMRNP